MFFSDLIGRMLSGLQRSRFFKYVGVTGRKWLGVEWYAQVASVGRAVVVATDGQLEREPRVGLVSRAEGSQRFWYFASGTIAVA